MGIPGFVIAQRLAKRICPACKQVHEGNHEAILLHLGFTPKDAKSAKPYHGAGCEKCNHTGYKGRQGIYDAISKKLREAEKEIKERRNWKELFKRKKM